MIVYNERAFKIYLKSCILAAGESYLQDFLQRCKQPIEVQLPEMGVWETQLQQRQSCSFVKSQFILCIEERVNDESRDIVFDWEIHYFFDKIVRNKIWTYFTYWTEEIEFPKVDFEYQLEMMWKELTDKICKKSNDTHKYSIHLEIWANQHFAIDKRFQFYFPNNGTFRKIDDLCDEIKYTPPPGNILKLPRSFQGGVSFQNTKEEFYKRIQQT